MGEVIKFPGKFHKDNNVLPFTGKWHESDKKPEANPTIKEDKALDLHAFLEKITSLRDTNKDINWLGQTAKEMQQLVVKYTDEQIIDMALKATEVDLKAKPIFYSALAEELLLRLEAQN